MTMPELNTQSPLPEDLSGETNAIPPVPEDAIIIIPVRNMVLFPGMVVPVTIAREKSLLAAQAAMKADRQIGIVLQRNPETVAPAQDDLYPIGTTASILRYVAASSEAHHIVCQGEGRFRLLELLPGYPFLVARIEKLSEEPEDNVEIEGRMVQLKQRALDILQMLPQIPQELSESVSNVTSASLLADLMTGLMDLTTAEKQDILETVDLKERIDKLLSHLSYRLEVLRVSKDIDEKTRNRLDDRQREALLREQLRTIQTQLGDIDDSSSETEALAEKIEKAGMPEEVHAHARKELNRLKNMPDSSSEYSMLQNYLEYLAELPWAVSSEDRTDIREARRILDEDHYGLEKIKKRILEFLAVHKLNPEGKSPILCFIGPPGVGKTSLGQSIARATGRRFVRVSMGGVHDEAEIRGHRRTYIGALPGNIMQAIRRAGTNNCVILLDEVDKLGSGVQGDPSAALLEVLDPAQNNTFRDNYLGVPFDLSKVLFICTANMPDTIPGPLRDRLEMIQIPGYTEQEKTQIALRYLIRRELSENGLTPENCTITEQAIRDIIGHYTREAGVRELERQIGSVFRHAAMKIAEGDTEKVSIDSGDISDILGTPLYDSETAMRISMPGIATGLAWTPVGGDILFIEASRVPGRNRLTLTGQLGDVMKESAQAALTLVKAHADSLGIAAEQFENSEIHVHVPAGAIPKDGPSAGVAMFLALASVMMGKPIASDHAMTGEISLRGLVLPVGGIREKVLAALRAGIRTVMLPARNKRDLDDIPEDARNRLQFVFLETVDDAIRCGLIDDGKNTSHENG